MNLFQQTSDGYRTWTYLIITNTTSHPWRHIAKLNRGFVNDCVNIFSSIAMCKHQFHVDHKRKMTPSYYFHCFCVRKFPLQREQPWLRKYKRLGLALFGSTFFSNNKYLCSTTTLAEKFGHLVLRKILILTFDLFFFFSF